MHSLLSIAAPPDFDRIGDDEMLDPSELPFIVATTLKLVMMVETLRMVMWPAPRTSRRH